jgi:hypothetical protein
MDDCFGNYNTETNGENFFYKSYIRNNSKVIFDVGARYDTIYSSFNGEVHYFEPVVEVIEKLKTLIDNSNVYFNSFGLSDVCEKRQYYPDVESFYDRHESVPWINLKQTPLLLELKRGDEYCKEKNVIEIDFMKIDTEGYEMKVLLGFGDFLKNVKIIQFEYGETFIDNKVKLVELIDYLRTHGFYNFFYLSPTSLQEIKDYTDHYKYCNIVAFRESVISRT